MEFSVDIPFKSITVFFDTKLCCSDERGIEEAVTKWVELLGNNGLRVDRAEVRYAYAYHNLDDVEYRKNKGEDIDLDKSWSSLGYTRRTIYFDVDYENMELTETVVCFL
jgi:hypothetical protein